jgi:transcription termination factor Rho
MLSFHIAVKFYQAGVDFNALKKPKQFLGAARNTEEGRKS